MPKTTEEIVKENYVEADYVAGWTVKAQEKWWSEEEVDKLEKKYKDLLKNMCP